MGTQCGEGKGHCSGLQLRSAENGVCWHVAGKTMAEGTQPCPTFITESIHVEVKSSWGLLDRSGGW